MGVGALSLSLSLSLTHTAAYFSMTMGAASIISLSASPILSFTHSSLLQTRHLSSKLCYYNTPPPPLQPILWSSKPISLPSAHVSPLRAFNYNVTSGALLQDAGATAVVMVGGYSLVSVFDFLTKRNLITQKLSRKLVHVLSGLLFMSAWPIFSTSREARYFAAVVPFANCLRLLVYGLSLASNTGLVKSVTRDGKPEELLKGPLYYVLILMFCVLFFWRESPVGVISLSMMCGGDGFADIVGRRFGVVKLPHNQKKSWVGSISMFIFGFSLSILMLYYFSAMGYFELNWGSTAEKLAVVSLVATVVESLAITEVVDDNIVVPLSSMLMASLFFGYLPPY